MTLEGKVAIVTGAAAGIGEAVAYRLSADGATVVVADIDAAGAERVTGRILAAGGTASAKPTDVTSDGQVAALVETAVAEYGALDVLVNNVGIMVPPATIVEIDERDWDRGWAVNVKGGFLCSKYAIAHMAERRSGVVLFTASVAGLLGAQQHLIYCATKAAVISMVKTLALDHGRDGVRVNCVCPGPTLTPTLLAETKGEAALAERAARIPLDGGLGRPEEIAALFAFLASDDASFVTGQAYVADGGLSAGLFRPVPAQTGGRL